MDAEGPTTLRGELEALGFSQSVIRQAEAGVYTTDQLEILKAQRVQLREAIQDQENQSLTARLAENLANLSLHDGTLLSGPDEQTNHTCRFRACPHCRSYFRDRVWASFEAVFGDEHASITVEESSRLPVKDARILRHIGLRPNPSLHPNLYAIPPSETFAPDTPVSPSLSDPITSPTPSESDISSDTYKTTQSDFASAEDHRLRGKRFYILSNRSSGFIARALSSHEDLVSRGRQSISASIKAIFGRNHRVPSHSTTTSTGLSSTSGSAGESSITLPVRCSGTVRDMESGERIRELDLGPLRRVRREQERADIRKGDKDWGFEVGPRIQFGGLVRREREQPSPGPTAASANEQHDEDSESNNSVYSCVSEGSEIEVDGGVALTEEAVETHAPDLVMVKLVPAEIVEETDDGDEPHGVDLASIMTQV